MTARRVQSHDSVGDAQLSLTGHTADAENSPLYTVRLTLRTVSPGISTRDPNLHDGFAVLAFFMLLIFRLVDASPDHGAGDLPHAGFRRCGLKNDFAVPEDDNVVTDIHHLMQAVRYEDDGDAVGGKAPHGIEQYIRLALRKNGGRFVQHQQPGTLFIYFASNFRKLLVPYGQFEMGVELSSSILSFLMASSPGGTWPRDPGWSACRRKPQQEDYKSASRD